MSILLLGYVDSSIRHTALFFLDISSLSFLKFNGRRVSTIKANTNRYISTTNTMTVTISTTSCTSTISTAHAASYDDGVLFFNSHEMEP